MEFLECSRYGAGNELPGGCENLNKIMIVKSCNLCNTDKCNYPGRYNSAIKIIQPMKLIFSLVLLLLKY